METIRTTPKKDSYERIEQLIRNRALSLGEFVLFVVWVLFQFSVVRWCLFASGFHDLPV